MTTALALCLSRYFAKEREAPLLLVNRDDINRRIMTNMLVILSLFILCTLPSRLVSVSMAMVVHFRSLRLLLGFQFLSYSLYSLQGTLNPILYSIIAREWRKSLSETVRSVFSKSGGDSGRSESNNVVTLVIQKRVEQSEVNQRFDIYTALSNIDSCQSVLYRSS